MQSASRRRPPTRLRLPSRRHRPKASAHANRPAHHADLVLCHRDHCGSQSRAPERGSATRSASMTAHRIGLAGDARTILGPSRNAWGARAAARGLGRRTAPTGVRLTSSRLGVVLRGLAERAHRGMRANARIHGNRFGNVRPTRTGCPGATAPRMICLGFLDPPLNRKVGRAVLSPPPAAPPGLRAYGPGGAVGTPRPTSPDWFRGARRETLARIFHKFSESGRGRREEADPQGRGGRFFKIAAAPQLPARCRSEKPPVFRRF